MLLILFAIRYSFSKSNFFVCNYLVFENYVFLFGTVQENRIIKNYK